MDPTPHAAQWTDRVSWSAIEVLPVLPREFYNRPAASVAKDVLGTVLVHGDAAGRIVEAEAYLGLDDLAAHASRGITPRTRVLFGPPGHAYVYLIYGMYECLNFVTEPEGKAGCVLIRALEPLAGIPLMRSRRPAARRLRDLASGPAKLTRALGINRDQYGADLTKGPITVRQRLGDNSFRVLTTPRIGVTLCADWPLRFVVEGSSFASGNNFKNSADHRCVE
ncbi:MAG TPA: DNA-3-methyladenine glycosylase [Bryobacteraceae bacterium]|nr:DNA-3-methyladenine glycosylase [Bryobacteraceae bacterium]